MLEREEKELERMGIKKEVASRELLVDTESDKELSSYRSVPSICVFTQVKETLLQAFINYKAEKDMISEKIIKETNLLTLLI